MFEQDEVKRNGCFSGSGTQCEDMAYRFGLLSGILPVSLKFVYCVSELYNSKVRGCNNEAGRPGTCVLVIVSLEDIGDIPSRPHISDPGLAGVIATWRAVLECVQYLVDSCLCRHSELGWAGCGKQAMSLSILVLLWVF